MKFFFHYHKFIILFKHNYEDYREITTIQYIHAYVQMNFRINLYFPIASAVSAYI